MFAPCANAAICRLVLTLLHGERHGAHCDRRRDALRCGDGTQPVQSTNPLLERPQRIGPLPPLMLIKMSAMYTDFMTEYTASAAHREGVAECAGAQTARKRPGLFTHAV